MSEELKRIQQRMTELLEKGGTNFLEDGMNIFDAPLLGVADAEDALFSRYKDQEQIIGSIFVTPCEWLPGARSVISYFLPLSKEVRSSNYASGEAVSEPWLHGRFRGEEVSNKLRQLIVDECAKLGGNAVAPLLNEKYYLSLEEQNSNWSERHIAYAAGLGTFSHGRSLISKKGCAGRYGSVVTDLWFEPTKRSYTESDSYCLLQKGEKCGKCIKRCPSGAITSKGKDKFVCYNHFIVKDLLKKEREKLGYAYSVCGKCQTKVPCESGIPE